MCSKRPFGWLRKGKGTWWQKVKRPNYTFYFLLSFGEKRDALNKHQDVLRFICLRNVEPTSAFWSHTNDEDVTLVWIVFSFVCLLLSPHLFYILNSSWAMSSSYACIRGMGRSAPRRWTWARTQQDGRKGRLSASQKKTAGSIPNVFTATIPIHLSVQLLLQYWWPAVAEGIQLKALSPDRWLPGGVTLQSWMSIGFKSPGNCACDLHTLLWLKLPGINGFLQISLWSRDSQWTHFSHSCTCKRKGKHFWMVCHLGQSTAAKTALNVNQSNL